MKTNCDTAAKIYKSLVNCGTKHMLLFLQYILLKVDVLNVEFQSEHFRLHQLHSSVSIEYKDILSYFVKEDVLNLVELDQINPKDVTNHVPIKDVYLGGRAIAHLSKEPFKELLIENKFRQDCLQVLEELAAEIKKRFSLDEGGILAKLNILDPKISTDVCCSPSTISPLAVHFPSIISETDLNTLNGHFKFKVIGSQRLT